MVDTKRMTKEEEADIRKHAAQDAPTTPEGFKKGYEKAAAHRQRLLYELACVRLECSLAMKQREAALPEVAALRGQLAALPEAKS